MIPISSDIYQLIPLGAVALAILVALTIEMYFKESETVSAVIAFVTLLGVGYYSLITAGAIGDKPFALHFNGMLATGGLINIFNFIFAFGGAVVVLLSLPYLKKTGLVHGEYYILILSGVLGMMLLAGARDLVMVFIGLEQMSMTFYILAGFRRTDSKSNEAALKYFLLGSFATGLLVYGMALLYGSVHSMKLMDIALMFEAGKATYIFNTGLVLFVIGFAFKIAAFPFHSWVPDVYQGSPTTVTAFMSTTGKAAAFMALIVGLGPLVTGHYPHKLAPVFAGLSVLSMLFGAVVAIAQTDIKRMLAYSSIAHAGYMLIGLSTGNPAGVSGLVFYLMAYTFMNLGAFGVISILESKAGDKLSIDSYAGLSKQQPLYAGLLALFMFALSGIPPFAGFFGKYYVFYSALQSGKVWLAIVGIFSSVISVYFYLRIIVVMYFKKEEVESEYAVETSNAALLGVFISAIIVVAMGVFPENLIRMINMFVK